jgi:hypothetical protein
LYVGHITICRKSTKSESSKVAEQHPAGNQTISPVAATSIPPPMVGTGLVICLNAEARHSTRQILQCLESVKDAEADREGNRSVFNASSF